MPLNWNIANCKDWETLKSDQEWPVTHALIWQSMSVGLDEITETNLSEWYARIHVWEKVSGAFLHTRTGGETVDRYITAEDLRKRIGMTTNATSFGRSQWLKKLNAYIGDRMAEYRTWATEALAKEQAA